METKQEVTRILSEALYDHQEVRISSLNRVRALIRRNLLELGYLKEEKKTEDDEEEQSWKDEELEAALQEAINQGKLSKQDYDFLETSLNLAKEEHKIELDYEKKLKPMIESEPIWTNWLKDVKGISTRNTTRLLKYFGYCEKFDTVSKMWAYAGLNLVCPDCTYEKEKADGTKIVLPLKTVLKGTKSVCPKCGKDGVAPKRKKGCSLPYNNKIKTGVLGVIGASLIKATNVEDGKRVPASYKQIYDSYKAKILAKGCCKNPKCAGKTGHASNMAKRRMVKMFLSHYWITARELKGLPCRKLYVIEVLGHTGYEKPFRDK